MSASLLAFVAPRPAPAAADEILTREETAAWLKVRPRQLDRLGVPYLDLGSPKSRRYLRSDVLAWLTAKRCGLRIE